MSKASPSNIYPKKVDLNNCDKEPIHLIGKVQNHGILIAGFSSSKKITRCSENCDRLLKKTAKTLLDTPLNDLLPASTIDLLFNELDSSSANYLSTQINSTQVDMILHLSGEEFILEIEEVGSIVNSSTQQLEVTKIVSMINNTKGFNALNDYVANAIKTHFGYDRVMIYQFDHEWNGNVVAEAKEDNLESWLGLHYPATDIPVPARRLFYNESTRIIKDVNAETTNIISVPHLQNLDLSKSEYRATSPIHIEYLKNMGVGATMTMPIVSGKIVWGLIACHHYSPKNISYTERVSCKFLAKFFASQVQINKTDEVLKTIKASSQIRGALISQIVESLNIHSGLSEKKYTLNDLTDSEGAAISIGKNIVRIGKCPSEEEITKITKRIKEISNDTIYYSDNFVKDFPEAKSFQNVASGIMCVFISESRKEALLWFKPEIVETVFWGGKPQEKSTDNNVKLSPRKSFKKWKEIQNGFSKPWKEHEIAAVKEFRKNVLNFVTQKYDEIKILNNKLKKAYEELESFSYSVSHDLRAPLRGIDGFAQVIKEDYFDSLDDFGKSSIDTIIDSVKKMNMLIDDILSYSGLDQKRIQYQKFEIQTLFNEEIIILSKEYPNTKIFFDTPLPEVYGDPSVITLLVRNLLENALKYSSREPHPEIRIGVQEKDTFYIKDNGIGFDQKHSENIFKVFNRLNNTFKGSGIGLSISKRVIDKHKGKIWAKSEEGKGAIFYFNLNQENE